MPTLKEYMSNKRHIKNEVVPTVLAGRDSVSGDLTVLELNSGALSVDSGGAVKDTVFTYRNDYSSTNVTTVSWIELIASTTDAVTKVSIFDSSGETLELGVGPSGSEVRKILIPAGGVDVECIIAAGSRVCVRAVSADASTGELSINFIG